MIRYFGYYYLIVYRYFLFLFFLFFSSLLFAAEELNQSSNFSEEVLINNSSLQKMFTRVEILQRINQDLRNRLEKLEVSNQSLSARLEELSVEFDLRIETVKYEFDKFKQSADQKLSTLVPNQKENDDKEDPIAIDFVSQDIYRQGIMAISLEDYQRAVQVLNQFINQVNPKATYLITKAKFWLAISELKLKNYERSFELFFELEQENDNNSQKNKAINFNLVKEGIVRSLIELGEIDRAQQLIKKYLNFDDKELTSLMQAIQRELK